MATYKVIQDVEAEDKLVGPLSLRQFIYAAIAAFLFYLSFFSVTKGIGFLVIFFVPPALFTGFLAVPWHSDQPTEVWALAKLRFFLRSRKRIWDQSGTKELVTVTVPKKVEHELTNGLTQTEVRSRLHALADTIDSRGWVVKNVNVTVPTDSQQTYTTSDRLIDTDILPQQVSDIDIRASDDILDAAENSVAKHFDTMIADAAASQRQELIEQMQTPAVAAPPRPNRAKTVATQPPAPHDQTQPQNDYWFMQQPAAAAQPPIAPPVAATPTADEEALVAQLREANSTETIANDHLKHIKTPEEIAADERAAAAQAEPPKAQVTSDTQAAILNLASNDDQDVATLARRAREETKHDDGEVVVSLR